MAETGAWSPKISINTQVHTLEHPLLNRNNTTYISLHSLRTLFKFSQRRLYKYDATRLYNKKESLLIIHNSREIWLNNTKHFLAFPAQKYKSRTYIPFKDIAILLGYTFTEKEGSFQLHTNPSYIFSSTHPLVAFSTYHVDKTYINPKNAKKSSHILYKHKQINLKNSLQVIDNLLYINAEPLLENLGYKIQKTKTKLVLTYNAITYTIPYNSSIWKGKENTNAWKFKAAAPIKKSSKTILFPFSSLFSFLDYSTHYNIIGEHIELLDNIHDIRISTKTKLPVIHVSSRHSLEAYDIFHDKNAHTQSLKIPFSISFVPKKKLKQANSHIKKITLRPITYTYEQLHGQSHKMGKKHSELTLTLAQSSSFFPTKTPTGLSLSINKTLTSYSIKQNSTHYKITLKGQNIEMPKIYKENKMIILDFPQTINNLSNLKRINKDNFRAIRSSQLSYSPLITRCVLDFNNTIPIFSSEKTENSLILTLKKVPQQKYISKRTKQTKGLRNKIIMLDPGHGGADPGAVVDKYLYEKTYTLDVAKRVKTLLEKEGAFVILSRNSDKTRSLRYRIHKANRNNADMFLSLHFNSFSTPHAKGAKTFYYKSKDRKLALHIQKQLRRDLNIKDNGIKRSKFFVLRHTKMPATLIEPLFLSNPREKKLLESPDFRSKLAYSIFQGVKNYYIDS